MLRFAITSQGRRARYWRVRAGMSRPELFLEREGYGKVFHFSLHESGRWHMKVGRDERTVWARPGEVNPGYTRAVGVVQAVTTAVHEPAQLDDGVLAAVSPDADPITFSLYIERPGANLDSWPGKNTPGTMFVGRLPLAAGGGTCCVVAREQPLEPGRLTGPRPSAAELQRIKEALERGPLIMTVIGDFADGAIALIDLRADALHVSETLATSLE